MPWKQTTYALCLFISGGRWVSPNIEIKTVTLVIGWLNAPLGEFVNVVTSCVDVIRVHTSKAEQPLF